MSNASIGAGSCVPTGAVKNSKHHALVELSPGDVYHSYPPGGGGVGDPFERNVQAIRSDVQTGLVSVARAAEEYGVVIDPETFKVDAAATAARREAADRNIA